MSLLDKRFETPYNTAPFSKIKTEDFLPAFVRAIKNAKIEIGLIADSKDTPSFKNTIEAQKPSLFLDETSYPSSCIAAIL